ANLTPRDHACHALSGAIALVRGQESPVTAPSILRIYENSGFSTPDRRLPGTQRARPPLCAPNVNGCFASLTFTFRTCRSQNMADLFDNPMGLMGFEFIELASPTPNVLEPVLESMGFTKVANHRSKAVSLFRQGDINAIVNCEPKSPAAYFAAEHGPSVCGFAFRVKDAQKAYARALELGAQPLEMPTGYMELRLPAIKGI